MQSLSTEAVSLMKYGYWGLIPSTVLLGVSLFQGYVYFSLYDDSFSLKVLVAFLLVLDISVTALLTTSWHTFLIGNLGKQNPSNGETPFLASQIINVIITLVTQTFFAHQVYLVDSKRRLVPVVIVLFALLSACAGITRITFALVPPYHMVLKPIFKVMVTCEGSFAAMSDIAATIEMCLKFVKTARYTRRLSSVIILLLIYTINRGVLVTAVQIVMLALFWYGLDKFYWCIGKFYVNTLLVMLNSRQRLRSKTALLRNEIEITQNNSKMIFNRAMTLQVKCTINSHPPSLPTYIDKIEEEHANSGVGIVDDEGSIRSSA